MNEALDKAGTDELLHPERMKPVEVGQDVFILLVQPSAEKYRPPTRQVGHATVTSIDEDGTIWVSVPKGHQCPWQRGPGEVFLTQESAESALAEWYSQLPSIREICSAGGLGLGTRQS